MQYVSVHCHIIIQFVLQYREVTAQAILKEEKIFKGSALIIATLDKVRIHAFE